MKTLIICLLFTGVIYSQDSTKIDTSDCVQICISKPKNKFYSFVRHIQGQVKDQYLTRDSLVTCEGKEEFEIIFEDE